MSKLFNLIFFLPQKVGLTKLGLWAFPAIVHKTGPRALGSILLFATILAGVCCQTNIYGQDRPQGRFSKDSVKIGEPVKYTLSFRHDPSLEVLFPDEKYDFSPFELLSREYFPTVSDSLTSIDSAVYTLATFELDPVQKLALPAYIIENGKRKTIRARADSLHLIEVAPAMPDSLSLLENTTMALLKNEFNYPYLLIFVFSLALIAIVVYAAFGKKIRKTIRIRKLKKEHARFLQDFEHFLSEGKQESKKLLEEALVQWKRYAGPLLSHPLPSLTTKEIQYIIGDEQLNHSLKSIDRAIYAGQYDNGISESLVCLKKYAVEAFEEKLEKIKNE